MRVLRYFGDPALRRRARPVTPGDEAVRPLADEMIAVMHARRGIGLAANQVGDLRRVIVYDLSAGDKPDAARVLVNPRVVRRDGAFTDEEGCLSFPGLKLDIRRALNARVEGVDLGGNPVAIEASGIFARVLQHEIDHLDGILFTDRLPWPKRIALLYTLWSLKRRYRLKDAVPPPSLDR